MIRYDGDLVIGLALTESNDGSDIYVAGYTNAFGISNSFDGLMARLNAQDGSILWTKLLGGTGATYLYGVVALENGNILMTGFVDSFGEGDFDFLLTEMTPSGSLVSSKTIGGTGRDVMLRTMKLDAGGYIMAGYTTSIGSGGEDLILIKLPEDLTYYGDLAVHSAILALNDISAHPQLVTDCISYSSVDASYIQVSPLELSLVSITIMETGNPLYKLMIPAPTDCGGCSSAGTCVVGSCVCDAGYIGSLCEYSSNELNEQIAKTTALINQLELLVPPSSLALVSMLEQAVSVPEFVTPAASLVALRILHRHLSPS